MPTEAPSWWTRLGGPNAISLPAWLLTLPGGVAATFTFIPRGAPVHVGEWLAIGLAAHVVTGLLLLPARATYLSHRPRPARPWAAVATFAVAGLGRGLMVWATVERLHEGAHGNPPDRILGAVVAVVLWFSLATLVVDGHRRYRASRTALQQELDREKVLAERSAHVARDTRERLLAGTQSQVVSTMALVTELSADPGRARAQLQALVDDVVRPLSHEIEGRDLDDVLLLDRVETLESGARPRLRDYAEGLVTDRPFNPGVTALVMAVAPLFVTVAVLGPVVGLTVVAASCVYVWAALHGARSVAADRLRDLPSPRRATLVIALWGAVVLGLALVLGLIVDAADVLPDSFLISAGLEVYESAVVASVALLSVTIFAAALEGAVEGQRVRTEEALRAAAAAAEWAASRLRQQAWSEKRRVGRTLHGEVQARIVALAQRLTTTAPQDRRATIEAVSEQIRSSLAGDPVDSWRANMADVQDVWRDAVGLVLDIDGPARRVLDEDPVASRAVVAVLGEGVTNAVRHGDADHVHLRVRLNGDCLDLAVVDDGSGIPGGGSRSGMGTALLDTACLDWSLNSADGVTTLRARVPCAVPAA